MSAKEIRAASNLAAADPIVPKFSDRELLFMDEYMSDLRPKRAAIAAGYAESTADEAHQWIQEQNPTKPVVAEEIRRRQRLRAIKHGITHRRVVDELVRVGLANMGDFTEEVEGGHRVVNLSGLPRRKLAAIQEITVEEETKGEGVNRKVKRRTRLRLHNKMDALDKLARHMRLYENEAPPPIIFDNRTINNNSGPITVTQESAQARYQQMINAKDVEEQA